METGRGPPLNQRQQQQRFDERRQDFCRGGQQPEQQQQQHSFRHGQQNESGRQMLPPVALRGRGPEDGSLSYATRGMREDGGAQSQSFEHRRMTKQLSERTYAVPMQSNGPMASPEFQRQGGSSNYEQRQMIRQMSERGYAPARTNGFMTDRSGVSVPHQPLPAVELRRNLSERGVSQASGSSEYLFVGQSGVNGVFPSEVGLQRHLSERGVAPRHEPGRQISDRGGPDGGYIQGAVPANMELRRHLSERGVGQPPLPGRPRDQIWQGGGSSMPDVGLRRILSERGVAGSSAPLPEFTRMQSDRGVTGSYQQKDEGQQQQAPYQQPGTRVYSIPLAFSGEQGKEGGVDEWKSAAEHDLGLGPASPERWRGGGPSDTGLREPKRVLSERGTAVSSVVPPSMAHEQTRGIPERAATGPRQVNEGQTMRMQLRSTPPIPQASSRVPLDSGTSDDEVDFQQRDRKFLLSKQEASRQKSGGSRTSARRMSSQGGSRDEKLRGPGSQSLPRRREKPSEGRREEAKSESNNANAVGGSTDWRQEQAQRGSGQWEAHDSVEDNGQNHGCVSGLRNGTGVLNGEVLPDSLGGYDEDDVPVAGVVEDDDGLDLYLIPVAAPLFRDGMSAENASADVIHTSSEMQPERLHPNTAVEMYQPEILDSHGFSRSESVVVDRADFSRKREHSLSRQPRDRQGDPPPSAPGAAPPVRLAGSCNKDELGLSEEEPIPSQQSYQPHGDQTSSAEAGWQLESPSATSTSCLPEKEKKRPPSSLSSTKQPQSLEAIPSSAPLPPSSTPPRSSPPPSLHEQSQEGGGSLATLLGSTSRASPTPPGLSTGLEAERAPDSAHSGGSREGVPAANGEHGSQLMRFLQMELPIALPMTSAPGSSVEFGMRSMSTPLSGGGMEGEKAAAKKPLKSALKKSSSFKSSHEEEFVKAGGTSPAQNQGEGEREAPRLEHESERPLASSEPKATTTTAVVKAAALAPQKVLGSFLSRFRKESSNGAEDEEEENEVEAPLNISSPVTATAGVNGYVPLRAVSATTTTSCTPPTAEFTTEVLPNGKRLVQCQWCSCKLVVPVTAQTNLSGKQKLRCAKCRQVSTFKLPVLSAAELKEQLQRDYQRGAVANNNQCVTASSVNILGLSEFTPSSPSFISESDSGTSEGQPSPFPPTRSSSAFAAVAAAKKLAQTRGIAAAVDASASPRVTINGQRVLTELVQKAASGKKSLPMSSSDLGRPGEKGGVASALGGLKSTL
eukprot:TRINITY_DN19123_c0_g1_i1.p1 TRINITY_DN19123_c0_g1~~TRINITY_DN19123_c0_g1_i1.p1  ORF type:complete len:1281 (-),score=266.58 TRINITY_DN19123_c0_g1_i1:113-3841(-)